MTIQQSKGRGRPRNPDRDRLQKMRRFYQLEKNDQTIALMKMAHAQHRKSAGKDTSDAEVIRWALRVAVSTVVFVATKTETTE